MLTSARKLFLIAAFLLILGAVTAFSQSGDCQGVCVSQQAANAAAENARLRPLLEQKIAELEAALLEKDKNAQDIRDAAAKNEADLKDALRKTELELAKKTGEVIQLEADRVRWNAVVDVLVKNSRKKSIGLIAF